jgi:hypothetical protein
MEIDVMEIVVTEIVVTEIAITEDLLPPEMATIAHLEEMISAKRMDYFVAVMVAEELEFTALPLIVITSLPTSCPVFKLQVTRI